MGVDLQHVPYRGGASMTTGLIAGVIPIGIDVIRSYVPVLKIWATHSTGCHVQYSVAIAARSTHRFFKPGYRKLLLENVFGLTGPAKSPPHLVARLNVVCNKVLVMPEKKEIYRPGPQRLAHECGRL